MNLNKDYYLIRQNVKIKLEVINMNLKAIILDIDGTLVNSQKVVSERTKMTLLTAQKRGIKLILASGRPIRGMLDLIHELEMDKHHGLVVAYNGASVMDCESKEIVFNKAMTPMEAQSVLNHVKNFKVIPMIAKDDTMYVNNVYNGMLNLNQKPFNIIEYEARGGNYLLCEKSDLAEFVDFPLNKILLAGQPEYLKEVYQQISEPFVDKLSSMFTASVYYEFTAKGIDKVNALNEVLAPMGIRPEDTISFGDGQNDLSIIKFAGIGVAMGNAVEELKNAADEITLSNDEDGIAVFLEKYVK